MGLGYWIVIFIIGIACVTPVVSIPIVALKLFEYEGYTFLFSLFLGIIASVILDKVVRRCAIQHDIKKEIERRTNKYNDLQKSLTRAENELTELIQKQEQQLHEVNTKALYEDNKKYNVDYYKEPLKQLDTQLNKEIPFHTTRVKSVTKALHKQFDHLLLEADWENVDLLIFYLTTGRADSLKEALLLVDQQRQTNQIVGAIDSASQHIAFTMQDTTRRLAGVMTGCFSELSKQIRVGHDAIIAQTSRTADTIEHLTGSVESMNTKLEDFSSSISAQGKTLLETKELNQALLNQANQSSQQLMAELRYNQRYWYK